jgi:hypothetical protein
VPRQLVAVLACAGLLLAATSRQARAQDALPPAVKAFDLSLEPLEQVRKYVPPYATRDGKGQPIRSLLA